MFVWKIFFSDLFVWWNDCQTLQTTCWHSNKFQHTGLCYAAANWTSLKRVAILSVQALLSLWTDFIQILRSPVLHAGGNRSIWRKSVRTGKPNGHTALGLELNLHLRSTAMLPASKKIILKCPFRFYWKLGLFSFVYISWSTSWNRMPESQNGNTTNIFKITIKKCHNYFPYSNLLKVCLSIHPGHVSDIISYSCTSTQVFLSTYKACINSVHVFSIGLQRRSKFKQFHKDLQQKLPQVIIITILYALKI